MRAELDVPFSHKEEAKALGAKWDRTKKIWYVPSGVNPEPFAEWLPGIDRSDPSAPYIYVYISSTGQARVLEVSQRDLGRGLRHSLSSR